MLETGQIAGLHSELLRVITNPMTRVSPAYACHHGRNPGFSEPCHDGRNPVFFLPCHVGRNPVLGTLPSWWLSYVHLNGCLVQSIKKIIITSVHVDKADEVSCILKARKNVSSVLYVMLFLFFL